MCGSVGAFISVGVLAFVCELLTYAGDLEALVNYNTGKSLDVIQVQKRIHNGLDRAVVTSGKVADGAGHVCDKSASELAGFEDLAVYASGELLAFSSDHSYMKFELGSDFRGKIKALHEAKPQVSLHTLLAGRVEPVVISGLPPDFELFPHGLAAYGAIARDAADRTADSSTEDALLLVVNHRSTTDALELFRVGPGGRQVQHLKTLTHKLITNLNDCVFITAREFYCTNWRSSTPGSFLDFLELYTRRPWGSLIRCVTDASGDGGVACATAATGLRMPNGIEVSADLQTVVVVTSLSKDLVVYDRDPSTGSLVLNRRVCLNMACDNLTWDNTKREGEVLERRPNLLCAGHPKALHFGLYYSKGRFSAYGSLPQHHAYVDDVVRLAAQPLGIDDHRVKLFALPLINQERWARRAAIEKTVKVPAVRWANGKTTASGPLIQWRHCSWTQTEACSQPARWLPSTHM